MHWRRYVLETVTLVVAAVVCALVANALAPRDKKLVVVSRYSAKPAPVPATTPAPAVTQTQPAVEEQPAIATPQPPTSSQPPAVVRKSPPAAANTFSPHPDKPYIEITYPDVKLLHDRRALFLDARRTSVYEEGHISGARPFSVWESDIDEKVNHLFGERSDPREQNEPIVVYCSGGDCEDSHMLAQKLWGIQFNNVYVYKDGFPDWEAHGAPVDRGPKP